MLFEYTGAETPRGLATESMFSRGNDAHGGPGGSGNRGGGNGGSAGRAACGGSARNTAASPGNVGQTLALMNLPDDILIRIVKTHSINEALFAFLSNLKQTNQHLYHLIRREMQLDAAYRVSVHNLMLVLPGTRIPCGDSQVRVAQEVRDMAEMAEMFNTSMRLAPNDVAVGDVFLPTRFEDYNWNVSSDDENSANDRYITAVQVGFSAIDYLTNLDARVDNTVNIARVPNVVRSVLGFPDLTIHRDVVNHHIERQTVGLYLRMVRVSLNHTMQNIQDAIAWREGLALDTYAIQHHTTNVPGVLRDTSTVEEFFQLSDDSDTSHRLRMLWSGIPWPQSDSPSDSDDEEFIMQQEQLQILQTLATPTPDVHPVPYPVFADGINANEYLDDDDEDMSASMLADFYEKQ